MVVTLENHHKGSNAPSIRSLVVDEEKDGAKPLVGVNAMYSLQCSDAVMSVSWVAEKTSCP